MRRIIDTETQETILIVEPKRNLPIAVLIISFDYVSHSPGAIYSILSVVRHNTFHSYTFDLGILSQTIWNTAYGRLFETSVGTANGTELIGSYLGNHVRPILLLIAPLYRLWPDPEASLLAGILLGVETGIPEELQAAFRDTGTAHIIAISGFNITILAGLFMVIFGGLFGRYRGALLAGVGILFYTLLVGAGASVVRAALMGGLTLLAVQIGRRQNGLNTLVLVAALMA